MRRMRGLAASCALAVAVVACGEVPGATGDGAVTPLAKASDWRANLDMTEMPFALAEVAADRDTAERAWRDNLPAELPEGSGDPADPGRYGDLDDVDFDTHVVVVWSSGESSACPGWLADIDTTDGVVEAERGQVSADACTDDYNPYVMLLAVERDRLPSASELPAELVANGLTDGRVAPYPDQ